METLYYRINHKSNLILFDDIALDRIKTSLENDLTNVEEHYTLEKIDIIYNTILKPYDSTDKIALINALCKDYKKIKKLKIDNNFSFNLCRKVSSKNFNMSFSFTSENINDIVTLIVFGFKKLKSCKKKINKYNILLEEVQKLKESKIDLVKQYKTIEDQKLILSNYLLPNEIVLLLEIFQNIKTLTLPLGESSQESLVTYLILFLNYEWLFPIVFNLNLDFSCDLITQEIGDIYTVKFDEIYNEGFGSAEGLTEMEYITKIIERIVEIREGEEDDDDEEQKANKEKKKEKKMRDILEKLEKIYISKIKGNSNIFDLMLLFINFIKQFSFLNELSINIPDTFRKEMKDFVKVRKIYPPITQVHFMDYLCTISNLSSLNIRFNALETKTFDNVLYMIKKNKNLRNLKINFFPRNSKFYTPAHLLKIEEANRLIKEKEKDMTDLKEYLKEMEKEKEKDKDRNILETEILKGIKNEGDIQKILFDKLERNLERFFLLLQTEQSSKLERITLVIDQPFIIENKDCYWMILKFIFNLLLELSRETYKLKEFKIICPSFQFDNEKYPFIETFLNGLNLLEKNNFLSVFHFDTQITNIPNITNILSYNLSELYLSSLDVPTFKSFIDFYQGETFLAKSQLQVLTIEMDKNILEYKEIKNEMTKFLGGNNPDKLFNLNMTLSFSINPEELSELMKKCNGNHIEKYIFKMKDLFDFEKFVNNKDFYYFNNKFIRSINRYMPILMKYNFYSKDKKNIAKKLIRFLVPSNKKKFIFIKNTAIK